MQLVKMRHAVTLTFARNSSALSTSHLLARMLHQRGKIRFVRANSIKSKASKATITLVVIEQPAFAEAEHQSETSCRYWLDALDLAQSPGEVQRGKNVFGLQIFIVSKYLVVGHSGTEQFKDRLNRITQPANGRFAMA